MHSFLRTLLLLAIFSTLGACGTHDRAIYRTGPVKSKGNSQPGAAATSTETTPGVPAPSSASPGVVPGAVLP